MSNKATCRLLTIAGNIDDKHAYGRYPLAELDRDPLIHNY